MPTVILDIEIKTYLGQIVGAGPGVRQIYKIIEAKIENSIIKLKVGSDIPGFTEIESMRKGKKVTVTGYTDSQDGTFHVSGIAV